MDNLFVYELLARQKCEENLKFAEKQRILRIARDSSRSLWNRFIDWAIAAAQGSRKPARA